MLGTKGRQRRCGSWLSEEDKQAYSFSKKLQKSVAMLATVTVTVRVAVVRVRVMVMTMAPRAFFIAHQAPGTV